MKSTFGHPFKYIFLLIIVMCLLQIQWAQAQTWSTNSPLRVARWAHTATLLTNGTVLIAGGTVYNMDGNFADTNACELYNPMTGASSLSAPMQYSRHSHKGTQLANGQVLITGSGGATSELYDPVSGSWSDPATMNDERVVHIATLLPSGQVLVAGGYNDNSGQELSSAELYDPASGAWTVTASMPYAADTLAGVLLTNGMVLVCGGYNGNNSVTNAVLYNPVNQTWANISGMNEARSGHTATLLLDGRVLVEGGNGSASAEVYDPVGATWTYVAPMNDGRLYPEACLLGNGQVIVLGDGNPDVELYDPINDTWTYIDSLPVPGNQQTATMLTGGQVTVTGGSVSDYNGPALAVVETYGSILTTPSLDVSASPLTGPVPLTVQFTSPGVDSAGNTLTNWNWNFGDGVNSAAQSPSHIYTNFGSFTPSLTAYSIYGASPVSVTGPGTVTVTNHMLNVTVGPQAGALPLTVQFASPGVDSGGNTVTNWSWDFGDGGSSTSQNPTHIYTSAVSFSPSLVARSTYGMSPLVVAGPGTITVTNTPNPAFRVLYSFSPAFGSNPNGGLTLSGNVLYGTTSTGGASNSGTLYAINTNGSGFTNLYSFNSTSGARPNGVILSGSTLYGPTDFGGSRGGGTVFAISTNGLGYTNLYNLNFNVDPNSPNSPQAPLVLAGNSLYGATWFGGGYNHGTLFSVATNGASNGILHSFITPTYNLYANNYDGIFASARLSYSGGTLYGTAEQGGIYGGGTIFSVITNQPGSFSILHYFSAPVNGTNSDGAFSFSGLVLSGSTLYGTTFGGGTYGNGTIFAVNINTLAFSNLYNFAGGNDGSEPHGGLTLSGNTLYGTTSGGGTSGKGALFSITTDGSDFTTLYSFTGNNDGADPEADLVLSGNTLYGTANSGGSSGNGTVFNFTLPSPLLLTNLVRLPGGSFQFSFMNTSGSSNTVFATTNLALVFSNWTSLGTASEVSSGHFQFTDLQTTNNSKRFYRVRSP
jgi:uncharacterized repeat protein (TIGR03803 family)